MTDLCLPWFDPLEAGRFLSVLSPAQARPLRQQQVLPGHGPVALSLDCTGLGALLGPAAVLRRAVCVCDTGWAVI